MATVLDVVLWQDPQLLHYRARESRCVLRSREALGGHPHVAGGTGRGRRMGRLLPHPH